MNINHLSVETVSKVGDIYEKVKSYSKIVIHRHVNPDPDALGSQLGLKRVIEETFPEKSVKVVGEEVEGLKFIGEMDVIEDGFYEGALVVVLDTANEDRISDERYKLGVELIKIDHHPNYTPYGDVQWVDTDASSTSEMIARLVMVTEYWGLSNNEVPLDLNEKSASSLFAGIVGDTGRFKYESTKEGTFEVTQRLLRAGLDMQAVYNEMNRQPLKQVQFNGHVMSQFVVHGKVAHFVATRKMYEQYGLDRQEASNAVNVMGDVEGVEVWVLFVEDEEGYRVRIRSKEIVINGVASEFDGGGHPLASGAFVKDSKGIVSVVDRLKKEVKLNS